MKSLLLITLLITLSSIAWAQTSGRIADPKSYVHSDTASYEVVYFQVKVKDADQIFWKHVKWLSKNNVRPYVQMVSNDGMPIAASTVDLWLKEFIEIVGYDKVFLMSGKPVQPPPCPPSGCH